VRRHVGRDRGGLALGRRAVLLGLEDGGLHQVARTGLGLGPYGLRLQPRRRQQLLGRRLRPLQGEPGVVLGPPAELVQLVQPVPAQTLELVRGLVAHPVGVALGAVDEVVRGGSRALGRLAGLLLGDAEDLLRAAAEAGVVRGHRPLGGHRTVLGREAVHLTLQPGDLGLHVLHEAVHGRPVVPLAGAPEVTRARVRVGVTNCAHAGSLDDAGPPWTAGDPYQAPG
jgi:hypothetical protein